MGTVLHLLQPACIQTQVFCFSPLLDGDGVASYKYGMYEYGTLSFSPLLDGDGVASLQVNRLSLIRCLFQSPSRWGRCCIADKRPREVRKGLCFSPLLDGDGVASARSLRMKATSSGFSPLLDGDGVASIHKPVFAGRPFLGFSPLLDGDGVASSKLPIERAAYI